MITVVEAQLGNFWGHFFFILVHHGTWLFFRQNFVNENLTLAKNYEWGPPRSPFMLVCSDAACLPSANLCAPFSRTSK